MLLKLVTGQEQPKVTVRVLSVIFSPNLQDSCFAVMSLLVRGCLTWANKYNTLASEKPFISGSVSKISIHRRQLCSAQHDQPTAGRSTGEGHLGKTPESALRWLLIDGSHQSGDRKIKIKKICKIGSSHNSFIGNWQEIWKPKGGRQKWKWNYPYVRQLYIPKLRLGSVTKITFNWATNARITTTTQRHNVSSDWLSLSSTHLVFTLYHEYICTNYYSPAGNHG